MTATKSEWVAWDSTGTQPWFNYAFPKDLRRLLSGDSWEQLIDTPRLFVVRNKKRKQYIALVHNELLERS